MPIEFRSEIPSSDQFWTLFQTTGWNAKYQLSPDELTQALHTSWFVISAYEGKKLVGHGNFENWCKEKFSFSKQTANNFMNVYIRCLGRPEIVRTLNKSILYKLASPNFPDELRENLFSLPLQHHNGMMFHLIL